MFNPIAHNAPKGTLHLAQFLPRQGTLAGRQVRLYSGGPNRLPGPRSYRKTILCGLASGIFAGIIFIAGMERYNIRHKH